MSPPHFVVDVTVNDKRYTLLGRAGEKRWASRVAGPCEPNEYIVQWKVRINDLTNNKTTIVRPVLNWRSPSMLAVVRALEYIALDRGLVWHDIIEADDPRLQ